MQKITWTLEALNDFEDYIDWYLQNTEWLRHVTSGEYQQYYEKQYAE